MAIIFPLRPRMSRLLTISLVMLIWIASIALSLPHFIFSTTISMSLADGFRTVCLLVWPDGITPHSSEEYIYNIIFTLLTYILPMLAMGFTYARIGVELWGSRSIGEITETQRENIRSKRRVVKMMIVVVIIFAICWLPYHIYFIVIYHYQELLETKSIQQVYLAIFWLAMSNSMYNPIIYCWMNSRFRQGFKKVFRWCPFVYVDGRYLSRREQFTTRSTVTGSPEQTTRFDRNGTVHIPIQELNGMERRRKI